jgi:hypothetical protein
MSLILGAGERVPSPPSIRGGSLQVCLRVPVAKKIGPIARTSHLPGAGDERKDMRLPNWEGAEFACARTN